MPQTLPVPAVRPRRIPLLYTVPFVLSLSMAAPGAAEVPGASPHALPAAREVRALGDSARIREWREDLDHVAETILATHPRPFAHVSRAAFDSARSAIAESIPRLDDRRLAIECMRMVALLGDGHTLLMGVFPQLGFDTVLPVWLRPFEDGLHVAAADRAHASLVGSKVVRIGAVTAEEAIARVASASSGDNRYTRLDRVPFLLMIPGVYHALGLAAESDRIEIEVERSGRTERATIRGGAPPAGYPQAFLESEPQFPDGWVSARDAARELPRCDRRPEEAWWFEVLPEPRVLYLRMRRVDQVSGDLSYLELYRRLFAAADSLRPAALVVDLRQNHGGNNMVIDPLVRGIVQRPWLDRHESLVVMTDRGTFSAAMNAAVFVEERTRALFAGEPTGGRVNHYGDARGSTTPNGKMLLRVSTVPWLARIPWDGRPWILPQLPVPSTFASWREGGDPVLDAALDVVRNGSLPRRVLEASRRSGVDAALAAREAWLREYPARWGDTAADELTRYLMALVEDSAWEDAVLLGEPLVRMYPEASLAWRFLGEAHLTLGHRDRAVECLRQAVKLNPRAHVATAMLRRLGAG